MSGILERIMRRKKKVAVLLYTILVMFITAAVGIYLHLNPVYYAIVYILIILIALLDYAVRNKMRTMSAPFDIFSNVRNVDYLVIGDFCRAEDYVPKGKTYVQIAAPGRSLNSSFQILRHTHSILKENGNVIIPIGNSKKDFMIFDMPFFHAITIKKYHLQRLKKMSNFSFIFSSIESVRFLIGGGYSSYTPVQNDNAELATFCDERGYSLVCIKKQ